MLDDVIEQIDQTLPLVYEKCERDRAKPSTDRLSRADLKAFQRLKEDPILNEEGTDICVCTHDDKKNKTCRCRDYPST